MLDRYSPYDLFPIPDPVFERECKRLGLFVDRDKPYRDLWRFAALSVAGCVMLYWLANSFGNMPLIRTLLTMVALLIVIAPFVVGFGADLYTVIMTANYWRQRVMSELFDALKLARKDDNSLVIAFVGVAEMRAWSALRLELAARLILAILFGGFSAALSFLILVSLVGGDPEPLQVLLLLLGFVCFAVAVLVLFVREPVWRLRFAVMLSCYLATRITDSNTAMLIGSGVMIALKLLSFSFVYLILRISAEYELVEAVILLAALTAATFAIAWWSYQITRRWLQVCLVRLVQQGS